MSGYRAGEMLNPSSPRSGHVTEDLANECLGRLLTWLQFEMEMDSMPSSWRASLDTTENGCSFLIITIGRNIRPELPPVLRQQRGSDSERQLLFWLLVTSWRQNTDRSVKVCLPRPHLGSLTQCLLGGPLDSVGLWMGRRSPENQD